MYVAFSNDRLEVVAARDLAEAELAAARDPRYTATPLTGPRFISVKVPTADAQEALEQAMVRQRGALPSALLRAVRKRAARRSSGAAEKLEELIARHADARAAIEQAQADAGIPPEQQRWFPIRQSPRPSRPR